ncbi:HAD family acid phosphatase [Nocardia thailandica]
MKKLIVRAAAGLLLSAVNAQAVAVADIDAGSSGSASIGVGAVPAESAPTYDSWIDEVEPVADEVESYLLERLPAAKRPAIVFDIDNTALESHYNFGFNIPAVSPILRVAQAAKRGGAAVFFVTDRPAMLHPWSLNNLVSAGYPIDGLYGSGLTALSSESTKVDARIAIEAQGYTIVAAVSNSDSDLAGGHAERSFKLPDYSGALR